MLKSIKLSLVRENPVALRSVDTSSEQFLGVIDSIKTKGFIGAISVREKTDATGTYYEVVDGLHRTTACKAVGLEEINADVVDQSDDEVLEAQIAMNIHKVETKPVEYTKGILRIMNRNPLMTEAELAVKLCKSPSWIKDRLSLAKITDKGIQDLIDEGKITLSNAFALAKLPESEQKSFVARATTETPETFIPSVQARVKEIRDAARQGASAEPAVFAPVEHVRKLSDVKSVVRDTSEVQKILAQNNATDAVSAFIAAIRWVLHVDAAGAAEQLAKHQAREAEAAALKERRAKEREAKKAEAAAAG